MPRLKLDRGRWVVMGDAGSLKIPPQQVKILWEVMCRPLVTRERLAVVLWPNPETMPDRWVGAIGVHICALRRKLRGSGVGIVSVCNRGYRLDVDAAVRPGVPYTNETED